MASLRPFRYHGLHPNRNGGIHLDAFRYQPLSRPEEKGSVSGSCGGKLGVSRQTISKWETDETLPDIRQAKKLSVLYGLTLDELISFDLDTRALQEMIDTTSDAVTKNVDWTRVWGKKYPILTTYQTEVAVESMPPHWTGCWGSCSGITAMTG